MHCASSERSPRRRQHLAGQAAGSHAGLEDDQGVVAGNGGRTGTSGRADHGFPFPPRACAQRSSTSWAGSRKNRRLEARHPQVAAGSAPIAGATRRPRARSTQHAGKSAPAAMVSGMPPEKRGLISKTTGAPLTMRHWMFDRRRRTEAPRARPAPASISRRIADGPAAIDDAGADHHALARHDRERPAVEVAEHVDRELGAVEVLLDHRRRDVVAGRTRARARCGPAYAPTPPRPTRGLMKSGNGGGRGSVAGSQVAAAATPRAAQVPAGLELVVADARVVCGDDTATRMPRCGEAPRRAPPNSASSSSIVGTTRPTRSASQIGANLVEIAGSSDIGTR